MDREAPNRVGRWPVLRVVPGHSFAVELLAGDWLRLSTHYCGRTVLCAGEEICACCGLCGPRSYWYLPVLVEPGRRQAIVELSSTASADLEQRARFEGGKIAAGLCATLSRKTTRSSVRCEVTEFKPRERVLSFDVWVSYVMAIFGLPGLRENEPLETYSQRVHSLVVQRSQIAADRFMAAAKAGVRARG